MARNHLNMVDAFNHGWPSTGGRRVHEGWMFLRGDGRGIEGVMRLAQSARLKLAPLNPIPKAMEVGEHQTKTHTDAEQSVGSGRRCNAALLGSFAGLSCSLHEGEGKR